MTSFARLREDSNKIGFNFLITELDTAETFLDVAETTQSAEVRDRNLKNAYTAYATVLRLRDRVMIGPEHKLSFTEKLTRLQRRLDECGLLKEV